MEIRDFALERYFARWEFAAQYNLCASDPTPLAMSELLNMADADHLDWWNQLSLGYTETAGHPRLRDAIADQYETISDSDVLTFSGAQEAIFLAIHALIRAGDHLVVVTPAYQSLHEVARSVGASITTVSLDGASGWSLDLEFLLSSFTGRTRAVVINFPHNPTGAHLSYDRYVELCQACDRRGIYVISDEVYRGLEYDAADRLPAAADMCPLGLSIGVMSKAYGLAGLRIGWIATADVATREKIARLRDYTTICSSAPSEVLAAIGLRNRESLRQRTLHTIQHNIDLWQELSTRNANRFGWTKPKAGPVAVARLVDGDADGFCADLVAATGILLLPGSVFDMSSAHFRIGLGRRGIAAPLRILDEFLHRTSERAAAKQLSSL